MDVSIVIPARAWDSYLEATLASIAAMMLPPGVSVDVVVALGELPAVAPATGAGVRVVRNPGGSIPEGLNAAIAASSGEVVVRVDARCLVQADHVTRVLAALADPQVGSVGGAALVLDRGLFGSAYAVAFNSVLLGPTVYRYRRTSGPVDTAYLGAWRRTDLDAVGGFDERMVRNQDNELSDRIRASGKQVLYDAGLVVGYFNARSFAGAMRHHHDFGLWRMVQRSQGQRALTPRHVAALGALGGLAVGGGAAFASRRTRRAALAATVVGYVGAAVLSWRSARRLRAARPDVPNSEFHPLAPALAPAVAAALDAAWIGGIVWGLARGSEGSAASG